MAFYKTGGLILECDSAALPLLGCEVRSEPGWLWRFRIGPWMFSLVIAKRRRGASKP